ncbi:longitudinals lacking protein, isoforms A/B/D/L-like isoform X2 [Teleopsis dalmanni]|nr:longitudinals lacking protein, isoforms A/B/D/L-like isoform X2 [Teleopsis dalmanni]
MPLVTQLREGSQPIVFPTDLSINAMEKSQSSTAGSTGSLSGVGITERGTAKERTKSPNNRSDTPTNEISSESAAKTSTPLNCSANTTTGNSAEKGTNGTSKLKIFSEEEATMLMLKAAAEKSGTNNSGNISDNSYGDDNGNLSGGGGAGGDYHATISSAGAFADVGGAAGLCNINILNSISAMNSLIGGSGNGGVSIGAPGGAGHPCPECGRVYKLKSSLRNHQKWECGKEPQFQCPFCVYRAKQKMHIGRHMERMHKEKFIKLDDIKTFTSSGASVGGDDSSSATATAAAVLSTAAELRQHFSCCQRRPGNY